MTNNHDSIESLLIKNIVELKRYIDSIAYLSTQRHEQSNEMISQLEDRVKRCEVWNLMLMVALGALSIANIMLFKI